MPRTALLAIAVGSLALGGCTPAAAPPRAKAAELRAEESVDVEAEALFREREVEGAFVLVDETRALRTVVNPAIAEIGFLPASTFKIPNTLIGLETGVIPNDRFSLSWDGQVRPMSAWNRDHDLASAMKFSVVWFYQEVARRIGAARMADGLAKLEYGNRDIGGGLDRFWLSGGLRITPREQAEWLRRLFADELLVSREHVALVRRLITLEEREGVRLLGKTGLTSMDERAVGWLVGRVERGLDHYAYALLVLAPKERMDELIPMRRPLAEALLSRTRALPRGWSRSAATPASVQTEDAGSPTLIE